MRRARKRRLGLMAAGGLLVLVLLLPVLAVRRPGWYAPPTIAPEQRQAVRNSLQSAAQAFSDALMQTADFQVHLLDRQINEWIAMREEIYPLIAREIPTPWRDPLLRIADGVVTVSATYPGGASEVVVSLDIAITSDSEQLTLRADALRVGALPVPLGLIDKELSRPVARERGRLWRGSPAVSGNLRDGLRLDCLAVWPNGDRQYRLLAARPEPGQLRLTIRPLGAFYHNRQKDQF